MLKRVALSILALAVMVGEALAASQSGAPLKFPIPFGNSAGSAYIRSIPQASQIGIVNCAASLTDGFPPLTFTPASAGGCPPFGQDFNGILKQLSQWGLWQGAGATVPYDSSFSSSIGGYPNGSVVSNATVPSCYWVSTVDNNTSNPDSGGADWTSSCPGGGVAATSTGSANAQIVAGTGFLLRQGAIVSFVAGFTNTAGMTVNVNGTGAKAVQKWLSTGSLVALCGGEVVAGQQVQLQYDGTQFQILNPVPIGPKWISLLSGSGTYTPTNACVTSVFARLVAGGGGGGAGGTASNLGGNGLPGAATSLGSLTTGGGNGGLGAGSSVGFGASGGSAGVGTAKVRVTGGGGSTGVPIAAGIAIGGTGGSGCLGGGGQMLATNLGSAGATNSGGGGAGGGSGTIGGAGGGGGGAGECAEFVISPPSAVGYTVGIGGAAGIAGGGGGGGGAGGSGSILIQESYN